MRVKVKRYKNESLSQLLKRFIARYQKSGIPIEVKKNLARRRKMNERRKKEYRMYRLKIKSFVEEKLKEGYSLEKALDMAKRYIQYIKYKG
jgi:DNA-binding transcriptional regulator YhcF (GntR family)